MDKIEKFKNEMEKFKQNTKTLFAKLDKIYKKDANMKYKEGDNFVEIIINQSTGKKIKYFILVSKHETSVDCQIYHTQIKENNLVSRNSFRWRDSENFPLKKIIDFINVSLKKHDSVHVLYMN